MSLLNCSVVRTSIHLIYGVCGRVGSTPPVCRSALYSPLLPPFGLGSVTVFDPAPLKVSPSQKPAGGFPAQASSYSRSPNGIEARLAMDSIPVVAACPPLRVGGVAIASMTVRAPLCSAGVTPRPRSYGGIRLPMRHRASSRCAGCTALPLTGGAHRISRVPGSALLTCHGLRPRWVRGGLGPWPL
jgi:hypothetical protein